ncbi:hypothetical protein ICW40_17240 [Actinotalea ferrariae]|nr:hypothetical protein [Actinotalea ferrariae]
MPARPTASVPSPHQPPHEPAQPATPPAQQAAPTSFAPQTFAPQTFSPQTFTPQSGSGAFDDEVTNMLAQRADIAQQALAELSQLSSYRPAAASGGSTLARRTPGTIPAAPEIKLAPSGQRVERDANQVRSLLSSFQSGTSRGRQATPAADAAAQTPGGATSAGNEDGSSNGHGEPVTTPDTDLNQRTTSW